MTYPTFCCEKTIPLSPSRVCLSPWEKLLRESCKETDPHGNNEKTPSPPIVKPRSSLAYSGSKTSTPESGGTRNSNGG